MNIDVRPKTGDDLLRLGKNRLCELVKGEFVDLTPPGEEHGEVAVNTAMLLADHTRRGKLGKVVVESGFFTARDPDTVRGPDVSFFRAESIGAEGLPQGYAVIAPDLAVEVVSPSDTSEEMEARAQELLASGVKQVWLVFPRTRTVHQCDPSGHVRVLKAEEMLSGGDVVPGFSCHVSELFDLQD